MEKRHVHEENVLNNFLNYSCNDTFFYFHLPEVIEKVSTCKCLYTRKNICIIWAAFKTTQVVNYALSYYSLYHYKDSQSRGFKKLES